MVINKGYDFSALKILIVDDHAPMRRVMRDILKELGVRNIEAAKNGRDALNTLKTFKADLIFTDYMMEPMDGLTMMSKIRSGEAEVDRFIPIVVVTAYTEIRDILKARDAGATEFLAKPFSAKLVYYRLRSIVENPRNYIDSKKYFGPDRRRREIDEISTDRRLMAYQYTSAKRKQPQRATLH